MPPGNLTTAHPHADRRDGAMLNFAVKLGPRNEYRFYRVPADTMTPEVLATIPVKEPGYVHSFGLTEHWYRPGRVPVEGQPVRLALSRAALRRELSLEARRRDPLHARQPRHRRGPGSRCTPMPASPSITSLPTRTATSSIVDASVYPDASLVEELYLDRAAHRAPLSQSELRRFRLRPTEGTVSPTSA